MQQSNAVGLVVISEEEGSQETRTLLIHRISKEGAYTRQSGRNCNPEDIPRAVVAFSTSTAVIIRLLSLPSRKIHCHLLSSHCQMI